VLPIHTVGADNESPDEAAAVAALARSIVGGSWTDAKGVTRPLGWRDVLIVAPYNAQVGTIQRTAAARGAGRHGRQVPGAGGTGQHLFADDVHAELAPRGLDFLYSRNRLNVATSRARCVAVVVGSPDLWRVRARTPAQMRLVNAFCRFTELATGEGRPEPEGRPEVEILTLDLV
jgi:uncharacterized protein